VSIDSSTSAFYFQNFDNQLGSILAVKILFRGNIALRAAVYGLFFGGVVKIETVTGSISGGAAPTFVAVPGDGSHVLSAISATPDFGTALGYGPVPPGVGFYGLDIANDKFYFNAVNAGQGVTVVYYSNLFSAKLDTASKFEGNVFRECGTAMSSLSTVNLPGVIPAYNNYFNLNTLITPVDLSGNAASIWDAKATASRGIENVREVEFLSAVTGVEVLGLQPDSPGRFTPFLKTTTPQNDVGMNNYVFMISSDRVQLDGLIIEGYPNMWGGVLFSKGQIDFKIQTCTVQDCAWHGLRALGTCNPLRPLQTWTDYANNDNGSMDTQPGNVTTRCTFRGNAGAGLYLFLGHADVSYISTFGNGTGIYESNFSAPNSITQCVGSDNSSADARGASAYTVSDLPLLSGGCTVDLDSTRLNALFVDPDNGDLRLQALAIGSDFDSPCIALGIQGAFEYSYGAISQSYTEIDFSSVGANGTPYRNPDRIRRSPIPIKLFEGDREDGTLYTGAVSFPLAMVWTWLGINDMPHEQTAALLALYTSETGYCQISFDESVTFNEYKVERSKAFDYEEIEGIGWANEDVPTPVKQLNFRESGP